MVAYKFNSCTNNICIRVDKSLHFGAQTGSLMSGSSFCFCLTSGWVGVAGGVPGCQTPGGGGRQGGYGSDGGYQQNKYITDVDHTSVRTYENAQSCIF